MKRLLLLLFMFTFALSSVFAMDDENVGTFESLDRDGNKSISKSEAKRDTALSANWAEADVDRNNQIDSAEFSAFVSKGMFVPPEDAEISEPGAAPFSTADVAQ
ncbi:MAG: hypothetical protein OEX00_00570 [Gammaproteobacteria bacterium]|nr:hypothetical protein [Gammaproteobacteria bacterium]MDH5692689.1 hypothetical protein [Gammaproteobacteria bacterium]